MSAALITTMFNVIGVPRVPVYPYAVVPASMEIPWFHALHTILQTLFGMNIAHASSQMDGFLFSFVNSIRFYLQIIGYGVDDSNSLDLVYIAATNYDGRGQIPTTSKLAADSFTRLEHLVKLFNRIFRWPYAITKAVSIIYFSFIMFSAIRKRPESPTYVVPVFFTGFLMSFFHLSVLMYTMGRMHAVSVHLLRTARERVCLGRHYDKALCRIVGTLEPMSIHCGKLYDITPTTMLTYFSVLVSYVVVVIQVKGN